MYEACVAEGYKVSHVDINDQLGMKPAGIDYSQQHDLQSLEIGFERKLL